MQKSSNSNRMARVNEELKRELSNIINYEVKNSNVTGMISVTKVKTSPDLKYARVSVSIINSKTCSKVTHKLLNEKVQKNTVKRDFICEEMDKRGISYDLEHPYTR